jgi:hypothetical protein
MKPIRTASSLLTVAVVLGACSEVPLAKDGPTPSYVCTAEASAGFTVSDGQWMTINVTTTRNYFITPETGEAAGRDPDATYAITEFGQKLNGPCKEERIPGMPLTQESVRAISCRILAVPDAAPDFYLNVEGLQQTPADAASVKFPFIRSLFRQPRGMSGENEDALGAPLLELLEMGTCTRIFKASPEPIATPVLGDCVIQPGSTVVTTRDGCIEVDARR